MALCGAAFAADASVDSLRYTLEVEADGSCEVTLIAVVDFSEAPEVLRIPLGAGASDVRCSGWKFRTETVSGVTCLRITDSDAFVGRQTFRVQYRVEGCVTQKDERQVFSLSLPGVGWAYPVESYEVTANFPAEVTHLPTWTSGYHGEAIDNDLTVTRNGATLTVRCNAVLRDSETMHLSLAFDDGSFDLSQAAGSAAKPLLWIFWLLLIFCPIYWALRLKNPFFVPKRTSAVSMEATAGETPCRLFGDAPDLAATLIHWANLGYLTFRIEKSGRVRILPQMDMGNERKASERRLFHELFGKNATRAIDASALAVRRSARFLRAAWMHRIFSAKSGNPRILRLMGVLAGASVCFYAADSRISSAAGARFLLVLLLTAALTALCALVQFACACALRRGRTKEKLFGLCAAAVLLLLASRAQCAALMFLNLLLQAFCGLAAMFGGRRSAEGLDALRGLLGLRSFLLFGSKREAQELFARDAQAFYRLLPFAEQLGAGAVFALRMGELRVGVCPWISAQQRVPTTAREFYRFYTRLLRTLRAPQRDSAKKLLPASAGRGRK